MFAFDVCQNSKLTAFCQKVISFDSFWILYLKNSTNVIIKIKILDSIDCPQCRQKTEFNSLNEIKKSLVIMALIERFKKKRSE